MTRISVTLGLLLLSSAGMGEDISSPPESPQALAQTCVACHGPQGQGMANYPRLAGLGASYLAAQLDAFDSGKRDNAIMKPMASGLTAQQRQSLADYFSGQTPPPSAVSTSPENINDAGKELALHGRWSSGIPACVQCHGPGAEGIGEDFPPLAGQPARYLQNQLEAWRSGKRSGDPMGLMTQVAQSLKGEDLAPVAEYFASLPAGKEASHE